MVVQSKVERVDLLLQLYQRLHGALDGSRRNGMVEIVCAVSEEFYRVVASILTQIDIVDAENAEALRACFQTVLG
jgi:hypothetical protein